jgi:flagellar biosynthesis protein FliP
MERFFNKKRGICFLLSGLTLFCCTRIHGASPVLPLITASSPAGNVSYSVDIKILLGMAVLTLLPALIMTMTSFTRIIVVLSILRQALGIPNVPSNQILIGLSLIMTFYIMMPIISDIQQNSLEPYLNGKMSENLAIQGASKHMQQFMLKQTRKADLNMFVNLASLRVQGNDYPFYVILPAFITSELKTAFQIGFLIFLPFLIIDLVTASVLMSMGMMMLSPMIISLPFKILFFVMVNGWSLMVTSLVRSFRI